MSIKTLPEVLSTSKPFVPDPGVLQPLVIHSAADFLLTPPEPRRFLLEDTLPLGEVGLIAGASGIGKSMLALEMGRAVSTGGSVCGGLYEVSTVILRVRGSVAPTRIPTGS